MRAVAMTGATAAHRALNCAHLPTDTSESVRSLLTMSAKELHRIDLQSVREFFEHVDCRGILLALEKSRIIAVEASTVSQFLLGHTLFAPQSTQIPGNDLPKAHPPEVAGALIYCHLAY